MDDECEIYEKQTGKNYPSSINIPEGVSNIHLLQCNPSFVEHLNEISIPSSATSISYYAVSGFYKLTKITIPLNETRMICGNQVYSVPNFKQITCLPESIEIINDEELRMVLSLNARNRALDFSEVTIPYDEVK